MRDFRVRNPVHLTRGGLIPQLLIKYLPTVNANSKLVISTARRHRAVLAYVLLLTTAYGALVGTVHSHGHALRGRADVVAVRGGGTSQTSDESGSQHRECSMCQLQRQLFDGFIQETLFARISVTETAFVSTTTVTYSSTSVTPRSSRAPPLICA